MMIEINFYTRENNIIDNETTNKIINNIHNKYFNENNKYNDSIYFYYILFCNDIYNIINNYYNINITFNNDKYIHLFLDKKRNKIYIKICLLIQPPIIDYFTTIIDYNILKCLIDKINDKFFNEKLKYAYSKITNELFISRFINFLKHNTIFNIENKINKIYIEKLKKEKKLKYNENKIFSKYNFFIE